MGYKKYSNIASAEAMIEKIKSGIIIGNTAYRELRQIANEWPGTSVGNEAEKLIKYKFSEYSY